MRRQRSVGPNRAGGRDREHDAQVDLRVGGKAATLLIEMKKDVYPRDVRQVLWQLRDSARRWPAPGGKREAAFFLIAQSISPGAKELLRNERVGYYDSGGSLYLPAATIYVYVDKPPPKSLVAVHPFRVLGPSCASAARGPAATSRVVRSE